MDLKPPSLTSEYQAWRDPEAPFVHVQVGTTRLSYQVRALEELRAMLLDRATGRMGNAHEGKPVTDGTDDPKSDSWIKV